MCSLNGEVLVCGQREGGDIQLRIYGDEFYARYESLDGYTAVYDTTVGCYCYVTLAVGRYLSTGVPVGQPVPEGIRKHLKEAGDVRNEKFERRYSRLRPPEDLSGSSAMRTLGPDDGLLEGRKLSKGAVQGLTILVDFDDIKTNIKKADVEEMLNGDNYTGNGNFCSVKKYFQTVSNGKLTYTNTVIGPVKLKKRRSHYIDSLLVEEALDAAIDQFGINLADFDSKGDGIVDAINFLYAGDSQYSGELWPHNFFKVLHRQGLKTHYYMLTGLGMEKVDLRIGTICHESGHLLCRFPDIYDYGKRDGDGEKSQGIGRYCLMGSGNHLHGRRTPSPVCAYFRELAGWHDKVVELNEDGSYVAPHGDYGTIMKYQTDMPNEYFLVENRSNIGLDTHLPSSGLAVYHCDTLGSNEWQAGTRHRHYQVGLLQADGTMDLENNLNAGDSGDLFSTKLGKVLSHDTLPSSRLWDGSDSGLTISDIAGAGESIHFVIGSPVKAKTAKAESFPSMLIPDNNKTGVSDAIEVTDAGKITGVRVWVGIIHSWIGDLKVTLVAPDGTDIVLHNMSGRDGDDIDQTYDSKEFGALNNLQGKEVNGTWRLRISDNQSLDVGRLFGWTLEVDYEGGASQGAERETMMKRELSKN